MTPSGIFTVGGGILLLGALLGAVVIMQENSLLQGKAFGDGSEGDVAEVTADEADTTAQTIISPERVASTDPNVQVLCGMYQKGCLEDCNQFSDHYQEMVCHPDCSAAYVSCLKTISPTEAADELTPAVSPAPHPDVPGFAPTT